MGDPRDLAAALLVLADRLEGRHAAASAGLVRAAARELATLPAPPEGACPGCGDAVTQPARGRRRKWCSPRCRNRAAKRHRNASVAACPGSTSTASTPT